MNERLNELIRKSYYECPYVTSYQWENNIVPPEQWAKFAELIVRDCISIVERHGSWIGVDYIKERFGIEE